MGNTTLFSLEIYKGHRMTFNRLCLMILFLTSLNACLDSNSKPQQFNRNNHSQIHVDSLVLVPEKGLVYYMGIPFSGISVSYYADGKMAIQDEYQNGKKHGVCKKWFSNGNLSYESQYFQGKKNGYSRTWWNNGVLRSESTFEKGVTNGTQRQWYKSGAKFKLRNIVNGKEEGLQQSWRENGKIYNNYEAKNGRIFGLKRAALCFELDDGEIKINN